MKRIQRILIAACSVALTTAAWAQSSADSSYLKRTAPRFESFAGSSDNYASLASGLRSGSVITLTGRGETVAFNSPTKPMGYGNITRSLDLAQRQLAAQGISNPTPTQLQAALTGGTIVGPKGSVTYAGVLQQRASGMGWGQIAHSNGLHPGMGKSTAAAAPAHKSITSAAGRSTTKTVKTARPESHSAAVHASSGRGFGNSPAVSSAGSGHMGGGHVGGGGMGGGSAGGGGHGKGGK